MMNKKGFMPHNNNQIIYTHNNYLQSVEQEILKEPVAAPVCVLYVVVHPVGKNTAWITALVLPALHDDAEL